MQSKLRTLALVFCLCFLASAETRIVNAQTTGNCESPIADSYLDIGNVRARVPNNGMLVWAGDPGVYAVPKEKGVNGIFASGLWLGGMVDGQLAVAAARYGHYQFWTGPLGDDGAPPIDCSLFDRVWRVARDDIAAFDKTSIASQDLLDWPTGLGAPTLSPLNPDGSQTDSDGVDNNGDGSIDEVGEMRSITDEVLALPLSARLSRLIDLAAGEGPDISGDQMLWWIMNDSGNEHRYNLEPNSISTPPLGVEIHASAFAFAREDPLGDATFYRYRITNKSARPISETHLGMFSDPDFGNFQDDYVASDSVLGIGLVYNADNDDEGGNGYGLNPGALAYDFLQGPVVESPGDTARVAGTLIADFRNLQMTSFVSYWKTRPPTTPEQFYNVLNGLLPDGSRMSYGRDGYDSSIPQKTNFMYPSNPGEFWSEINVDGNGVANPPADRRFTLSTGPFEIAPGATQEVIVGIIWAQGADHLDSVRELKVVDQLIQRFFDSGFRPPRVPEAPILRASGMDRRIVLTWTNSEASNNYLDLYKTDAPFADRDHPYYLFEGYEVWAFDGPDDIWPDCVDRGSCRLLQTIDIENGITEVFGDDDRDGLMSRYVRGTDSGLRHSIAFDGVTNYRTYSYGVRAYAVGMGANPSVLFSPFSRQQVVPGKPGKSLSTIAIAGGEAGSAVTLPGTVEGTGNGSVFAAIVDPTAIRSCHYEVTFYELPKLQSTSEPIVSYDIACGNEKVFNGSAKSIPAPLRENAVLVDGLEFSIVEGTTPFSAGDVAKINTDAYAATDLTDSEKIDRLAEIGIVPNPYRGASLYETSDSVTEVRLTNMPDVATVKIFALNGTLIRTLHKDSPGQTWMAWDLLTESGRRPASGMYLVHVDVPGVGERVVKFGFVGRR